MKRAADLALRIVSSSPRAAEAVVVLDPRFAGFAGHFPGAAVLPGMCQVDLALRAASRALGTELDLAVVDRARFLRKVHPGEELRIRLAFAPAADSATTVTADLTVGGETAATLRLVVTRQASRPARR